MPTRNRKASRKNRKTCRKNKLNRKSYRKNRKSSRKTKQAGGANHSLLQGQQFMAFHKNQHGGALTGAPLSEIDGSMLPQELRLTARIGGLDDSINAARAQGPDQPQQGGRRNRKSVRKASKKEKKSKKSRRYRKQYGGSAPVSQPTMLLNDYSKTGAADFSNALLKN